MKKNKENVLEQIMKDRAVRQAVTRESHTMFFHIYFPHYVKYPLAEFHKDIFRITEDQSNKLACIVAFRGSGKSTLVTLSYTLWAILGIQQKKFVLIICRTQAQVKQQMMNVRRELESNPVLRSDLGPFQEENGGEWASSSIVFKNTGARIMVASTEQSIRGIRHHEHRPDLIICDDIEDLNSSRTMEGRNKIFDWFTREIIPLGDIGTRIILVGNLLHEDSLMMRLRKKIEAKELKGIFKWFPLLTEDGECLWPGKFDSTEKIDELRLSVANELAWQQEYLLNIISDSTRVIFSEWIHRYPNDILEKIRDYKVIIGVDLAISQRETADYTAMVAIKVTGSASQKKIYIMPNPVNKRLPFPDVISKVNELDAVFGINGVTVEFIVESNGFQELYVQTLCDKVRSVKGVKHSNDKRSRLALTSTLIREGVIMFPEQGAEELIAQLTGFGVEHHDDLADAFSMAIIEVIEDLQGERSFEAWLEWVKKNGGTCWI